MNGYALANAFRTLRESWRFTSTEADLYYELVGIANERGWPAGFQYSNQLICATIGISEKSLIAARNRLKQAGLLDFVSGHKRAPTSYALRQKGLPQVSKKGGKSDSVSDSESDSPLYKELKQKENELQKKIEEERAASAASRLEFENQVAALKAQVEQLASKPKEASAPPVAAAPPLKGSRGGKKLKPPGSADPNDYTLPTWADESFVAQLGGWLGHRQTREDAKPLQAAAIQARINQLGRYDADFCNRLFESAAQNPHWQGLTFDNTDAKYAQHVLATQKLQQDAARQQQPERGAKPTGNAISGARALSQYLRSVNGTANPPTGGPLVISPTAGTNGFQG